MIFFVEPKQVRVDEGLIVHGRSDETETSAVKKDLDLAWVLDLTIAPTNSDSVVVFKRSRHHRPLWLPTSNGKPFGFREVAYTNPDHGVTKTLADIGEDFRVLKMSYGFNYGLGAQRWIAGFKNS